MHINTCTPFKKFQKNEMASSNIDCGNCIKVNNIVVLFITSKIANHSLFATRSEDALGAGHAQIMILKYQYPISFF